MRLTHHADHRRIQRSLPPHVISTIYEYGSAVHSRGAVSLTLDECSIALATEDNRCRRIELERYSGAFVVVADGGCIVTGARRTRRFRR